MLGGHSSGGNIAYEMAQQLLSAGEEVAALVLLDSMAPVPGGRSEDLYEVIINVTNDTVWLASIVLLVEHFFSAELNVTYRGLRELPMEEQYEKVLDALKRINFVAPSADAGAIRGMVENFRKTLQSTMQYGCKVYDGRIFFLKTNDLFTAMPDGVMTESTVKYIKAFFTNWRISFRALPQILRDMLTTACRSGALRRFFSDNTLGWQRFSTQPVQVYPVPGNHISMLTDPHAKVVAEAIRTTLDAAEPKR